MPVGLVPKYANNQFGLGLFESGLNEQIGFWAINNSGMNMAHGDVVRLDTQTTAPPSTTNTTINGTISLTQASQTITVVSTTGMTAPGVALVMATITGTPSATSTVPVFVAFTGSTGTTFTGATAALASVTNGLVTGAQVTNPPVAPLQSGTPAVPTYQPAVGLPAATTVGQSDSGRYVTMTGTANDPLVCGVVSLTGDAGTATTGNLSALQNPIVNPNYAAASIAQPVVPSGGDVFIVTNGVARVQIGAGTVAASALLTTSTIPRQGLATGTIGNLLGIALEAQSAKDANNTIRALIKIG